MCAVIRLSLRADSYHGIFYAGGSERCPYGNDMVPKCFPVDGQIFGEDGAVVNGRACGLGYSPENRRNTWREKNGLIADRYKTVFDFQRPDRQGGGLKLGLGGHFFTYALIRS